MKRDVNLKCSQGRRSASCSTLSENHIREIQIQVQNVVQKIQICIYTNPPAAQADIARGRRGRNSVSTSRKEGEECSNKKIKKTNLLWNSSEPKSPFTSILCTSSFRFCPSMRLKQIHISNIFQGKGTARQCEIRFWDTWLQILHHHHHHHHHQHHHYHHCHLIIVSLERSCITNTLLICC